MQSGSSDFHLFFWAEIEQHDAVIVHWMLWYFTWMNFNWKILHERRRNLRTHASQTHQSFISWCLSNSDFIQASYDVRSDLIPYLYASENLKQKVYGLLHRVHFLLISQESFSTFPFILPLYSSLFFYTDITQQTPHIFLSLFLA